MAERTDNAIIASDATNDSVFRMSGFKIIMMQIKTVLLADFFAFFKTNAKSLISLVFAIFFAIISAIVLFWSFKQIDATATTRQHSQLIIQQFAFKYTKITQFTND